MLTFFCSDEWILNTLKGFVWTFCIYDFTRLVADINNDKESDFEVDLVVEAPTEEPIEVSADRNAPSISNKIARKLLQGKNILIVINDD